MADKKFMTKSQLIAYFAEKLGMTKKQVGEMFGDLAALAAKEVKRAGAFVLPDIGKLVLVKRAARMGRNPATGEAIKIPAKTVVKARLAKAFKEAVVPPKK
jgi:DNA-binding protein HU-beta